MDILDAMTDFFHKICADQKVFDCLSFQRGKFTNAVHERYTHTVRHAFGMQFVKNGLKLARQRQEEALARVDTFIED